VTAISGGSIHTSGAQSYDDAVTLGAATTLTGVNVQFAGTLERRLCAGRQRFRHHGICGRGRRHRIPLVSITTDAPGSVDVNTTAITTSGAQTYHENMTLGANASLERPGPHFWRDGRRRLRPRRPMRAAARCSSWARSAQPFL
jgi:hypothetical protein